MKQFFKDFKTFISRGNIVDLAIGVIIGGAFSAIVTAFTNKIIMPLVNWAIVAIVGSKEGLSSIYTFLRRAYIEDAEGVKTLDLANSIYIDWGAFITALLDFFIIALTLFIILKIAMKSSGLLKKTREKALESLNAGKLSKEDRKALKEQGIDVNDQAKVQAYLKDKAEKEQQKLLEEENAKKLEEETKLKNSPEYLLKEIRDLLKENAKNNQQ